VTSLLFTCIKILWYSSVKRSSSVPSNFAWPLQQAAQCTQAHHEVHGSFRSPSFGSCSPSQHPESSEACGTNSRCTSSTSHRWRQRSLGCGDLQWYPICPASVRNIYSNACKMYANKLRYVELVSSVSSRLRPSPLL
jgi:hypothetical protein